MRDKTPQRDVKTHNAVNNDVKKTRVQEDISITKKSDSENSTRKQMRFWRKKSDTETPTVVTERSPSRRKTDPIENIMKQDKHSKKESKTTTVVKERRPSRRKTDPIKNIMKRDKHSKTGSKTTTVVKERHPSRRKTDPINNIVKKDSGEIGSPESLKNMFSQALTFSDSSDFEGSSMSVIPSIDIVSNSTRSVSSEDPFDVSELDPIVERFSLHDNYDEVDLPYFSCNYETTDGVFTILNKAYYGYLQEKYPENYATSTVQ